VYTADVARPSAYRPRIVSRILFVCLLCVLLPLLGLTSARLVSARRSGQGAEHLSADIETELTGEGQRVLDGQASAISARLASISDTVRDLALYTTEVLRAPDVYGSFHRPAAPAPSGGQATNVASGDKALPPTDQGQTVDNSLFYVTGQDGALRKAVNDKKSAVFFQRRPGGIPFANSDMNRVYATATLEPLLKGAQDGEPLVSSVYVITSDNLIRTYPIVDVTGWPADKDFTGLAMYAYMADKANKEGVVWTSPYVSHLTKQWVVACLGGVMLNGHKAAVCGVELSLSKLAEQTLDFSLGEGATCWLQQDDGTLLAAQPGGDALLRVIPIGKAELPAEKRPDSKIKSEANLQQSGAKDVVAALGQAKAGGPLAAVGEAAKAQYAGLAPVEGVGWDLCGLLPFPELARLRQAEALDKRAAAQQMPWIIGLSALGAVLGMLLGYFEARRISQPLQILTQRLRRNIASRSASPVAIADDSEVGGLAAACQELVDAAFGNRGEPPVVAAARVEPEDESTTETQRHGEE
jgi:hypothetical protein